MYCLGNEQRVFLGQHKKSLRKIALYQRKNLQAYSEWINNFCRNLSYEGLIQFYCELFQHFPKQTLRESKQTKQTMIVDKADARSAYRIQKGDIWMFRIDSWSNIRNTSFAEFVPQGNAPIEHLNVQDPWPSSPWGSKRTSPFWRSHFASSALKNWSNITWAPLEKSPNSIQIQEHHTLKELLTGTHCSCLNFIYHNYTQLDEKCQELQSTRREGWSCYNNMLLLKNERH